MQFPQDKFSKRSETHTDILFFPAIQTQIKESGDRRSHSNGALSVYQTRNRYAYPTWEFQICAPQKQNEEYLHLLLETHSNDNLKYDVDLRVFVLDELIEYYEEIGKYKLSNKYLKEKIKLYEA